MEALHAEGTDCYRLFNGPAEGAPGITVDRYGPLLLVQTRPDLAPPSAVVEALCQRVRTALGACLEPIVRVRCQASRHTEPRRPAGAAVGRAGSAIGREMGIDYLVATEPRRPDPLLYLDLRAGRRRIAAAATGRDVLNLFAYTCTAGVCAAAAGARQVWNVDWSQTALAIGRQNAERNGISPERFVTLRQDFHAVVRQLAGLPLKGRGARSRSYRSFARRSFDLVVLDPPPWSVGPLGAVDSVRDYESLFKPTVLATRPGGHVLATNHAPEVELASWLERLVRCADKAGRPVVAAEVLEPEADFPSLPDGPLLKMAWLEIGGG